MAHAEQNVSDFNETMNEAAAQIEGHAEAGAEMATDAATEADRAVQQTSEKFAEMFGLSQVEMPEAFRVMTERTLTNAREGYARVKAAAEETTDVLEDTVENARDGVLGIQYKALDQAKASSDASFDFARQMLGAATFADAVQAQSAFMRGRFEAMIDYSNEMRDLFTKVTEDTTRPVRDAAMRNISRATSQ
ncbi:phasin family protein [Afifella sp. IM 167]|uniref:phasin family protein n=1 Tax=Afifella sp. IM 167 TaxID=2033586 RepID=UPI001CC94FAB|nr:phasin family protein [Afifella sp. IM 167]MBZ8135448.1 phasin family protein [Afifella sp. IM 167]